ncbi:hypothetical protein [Gloeothece verrucosa]|uniref:TFIIS N-terminal domain-containing protein n=1 Tax=Gloeothece verrucosa (strain PCC 7822) TaxID=497965 RepID=E0UN81_GLOV7|nr:hypothetical protein [Gloeothece verrucosa]ADN18411.1 hypothetical protein Cyan7822_6735 [Gloeothece verrucosa PCC 7822]
MLSESDNNSDEQILEAILLLLENLPIERASQKLKQTHLGTIINVILKKRQSPLKS